MMRLRVGLLLLALAMLAQATRPPLLPAASGAAPSASLIQNGDFESGTLTDPLPWVGVSTRYIWNAPLISTTTAYHGLRGARLGGWAAGAVVDEELNQSFILPANTVSLTWETSIKLSPDLTPPDPADIFLFTITDATTGQNLMSNGGLRLNDLTLPFEVWVLLRIRVLNMQSLAGRNLSLNYRAFSNETRPTLLAMDDVRLFTHCAPAVATPAENGGLQWQATITPLP